MLRYIKIAFGTFPKLSLLAFVLIIFSVGLELPLPLFTIYFIDKVLPSKDVALLNLIGFALIGFLVLNVASGFINNYLSTLLFEKIAMRYGILSFKSFLDSNFFSSISKSPGYWANRIQNEPQSIAQLFRTLIDILTQGLTLIVGIFFIFYFNVKLGLFVLLIVPFYTWALFILSPKMRTQSKTVKEERSKLSGLIEESLSAFETIKVLSLENLRKNELESGWDRAVKENVKYTVIVSIGNLVATGVASIAPVGVLWYGGYLVMAGGLTLGELIGINKFLSYVFKPIASFMGINARIQDTRASLERLDEIINLPKENQAGKSLKVKSNDDIRIESLSFSYTTEERQVSIFSGLNLTVQGGKVTAILGESGCGKSTLLRLIIGLLKQQSGRILVDGVDISVLSVLSLKQQVCLIPQNTYLFSGSLQYNIALGVDGKDTDSAYSELLDATGVSKFTAGIPGNVSTSSYNIGPRGLKLSGGERQRVALARALLRDPAILLMDEVTSEIDLETEKEIIEKLMELRRGKTTVIVAHRLSAAIMADEIIVFAKGEVVERGSHRELVSTEGTYHRMWLVSQGRGNLDMPVSTNIKESLTFEHVLPDQR